MTSIDQDPRSTRSPFINRAWVSVGSPVSWNSLRTSKYCPGKNNRRFEPETEIKITRHTMNISNYISTPPTLQCQLHKTRFFLEDRVGTKGDFPHVPFREGLAILEEFHHFSDKLDGDGVFSSRGVLWELWADVCLVEFTSTYITS